MILSLIPFPPSPLVTTVQFLITPHPEKVIVGTMTCWLPAKKPLLVPPGSGKVGASQVPVIEATVLMKSIHNNYTTAIQILTVKT